MVRTTTPARLYAGGLADTPTNVPVSTSPLTFWIVPEVDVVAEAEGPEALARGWSADRGDVVVEVGRRPGRGEVGITAFLSVHASVLPERLPDVALIPIDSVADAVAAGWLRPLPPSLETRAEAAWPFARDAVLIDGRWWAVPLAVDLALLFGTETAVGAADWPTLLETEIISLPADPVVPGSLPTALTIYVGYGGDPTAVEPTADVALEMMMHAVAAAAAEGSLLSEEEPLELLRNGSATAAIAAAGAFAARPDSAAAWGPIPGLAGPAHPVATGWALVLPAVPRDDATARWAEQLADAISDPAKASWTVRAGLLPAHQAALGDIVRAAGGTPPGFIELVAEQLNKAVAPTSLGRRGPLWVTSLAGVLAGEPAETAVRMLRTP